MIQYSSNLVFSHIVRNVRPPEVSEARNPEMMMTVQSSTYIFIVNHPFFHLSRTLEVYKLFYMLSNSSPLFFYLPSLGLAMLSTKGISRYPSESYSYIPCSFRQLSNLMDAPTPRESSPKSRREDGTAQRLHNSKRHPSILGSLEIQ